MNKGHANNLPMMLKMLRLDAGLSQEEFALKAGISRSGIANYETGKRRPDIETIRKFADIYGVTIDVLIGNDSYDAITMRETTQTDNTKWKKLLHTHKSTLDISHFPIEYRISMTECYKYALAKYTKKEYPVKN